MIFVCMCMVTGGGDILFQAINTGGGAEVKNKWEGWIYFGPKTGLHYFQTLNGGGVIFSCLIDTHFE